MARKPLVLISLICLLTTSAFAAGYSNMDEDLYIPQTTKKTLHPDHEDSVFDDVRLHAGVAYLTSFQDVPTGNGTRERGGLNGFDLNFGIDLFSPNWIAEGHVMNFPEASIGSSRVSSNGFELRILYDTPIAEGLTVHGGAGIASRSFNIKTTTVSNNLTRRFDKNIQAGATSLVGGLDYWPSGQLSIGAEVSNHFPMTSDQDPNTMELAIKLNGHF
jgi:opacity protein-like surface antigen